ncbi:hypothetical protein EV426DRAFT_704087 [Tirmania nivea]|nr:hypothetical protein EV426DRAFT_704087 [Tirmania nivea]
MSFRLPRSNNRDTPKWELSAGKAWWPPQKKRTTGWNKQEKPEPPSGILRKRGPLPAPPLSPVLQPPMYILLQHPGSNSLTFGCLQDTTAGLGRGTLIVSMPSEFSPGPFDFREPTLSHDCVSPAKDERLVLPNTAGQIQTSETFASRACGYVFGTPTFQCYTHSYTPSSVNSSRLGLEQQAAREQIGMAPVIRNHPIDGRERGIIGLLAIGQERVLHFVSGGLGKQRYPSQDSPGGIIEFLESSGKDIRDAQSLASQEQHVVFSDPTPHKDPAKEPEAHVDTSAILAGESSGSSSPSGFSIHSRKTPYPSPVVLGELILQQVKEEADGSNDDDPKGDLRKKKVRMVHRSRYTHSSSSSSASPNTMRSRMLHNNRALSRGNSHKRGNKLGRAIKRILFRRPKKQYSQRSGQRKLLSTSSQITVSVDTGVITPTLPQGGTREISANKQMPSLMIQGLDRDFLPTEATLVPTPLHSPILGGPPLSFEEAMSTLPSTTDPTPTSSELEQSGVIFEQTTSPEVILTRPLLTQDMNEISPFFKMSENFPAPPTPPLPRAQSSSTRGPEETYKLPKLDTHGLLSEDNYSDKFGHQQKKPARRKSSTTASVIAFLSKPFTKRNRRDLVASVSNEKDKDSAMVGLKDYLRDARRRNNFDSVYPVFPSCGGSRSMTASPALGLTERASLPVIEGRKPFYEFSEDFEKCAIAGTMEYVQEEEPIVEKGSNGVIAEDNGEKKLEELDAAAILAGALGNSVASGTSTVPVSTKRGAFLPPLEMSPFPPSPILRPASTIPTTIRHERINGSCPCPNLVREEEEEMTETFLPFLPFRGDRDDAAYQQSVDPGATPNPSLATQWSGSTMGTGYSEYSEDILARKMGRAGPYVYKFEAGTLEENGNEGRDIEEDEEECEIAGRRASTPTRAASDEVGSQGQGRSRSRGESEASEKSWMTGKTTLGTGVSTGKATMGSESGGGRSAGDSSSVVAVGSQDEGREENEGGGRRCGSIGGGGAVEKMIGVEIERRELMGSRRACVNPDDEDVD